MLINSSMKGDVEVDERWQEGGVRSGEEAKGFFPWGSGPIAPQQIELT